MQEDIKNKAVIDTLMDRFEKQRLPRLLSIKESVDKGEKLSNIDIEFLEQSFKDARQNEAYRKAAGDDLKELITKVVTLYKEITSKALENEKNSS
jgi:hypothetical protein